MYISRQKVVAAALRFFEGLVNPMHCGDTVRSSSVLHVLRFTHSCTTSARNLFSEEYTISGNYRAVIRNESGVKILHPI